MNDIAIVSGKLIGDAIGSTIFMTDEVSLEGGCLSHQTLLSMSVVYLGVPFESSVMSLQREDFEDAQLELVLGQGLSLPVVA